MVHKKQIKGNAYNSSLSAILFFDCPVKISLVLYI